MPTSYEIYQTYLRGPAAVIRLFEQALGTQAIYSRPAPDMQQRTIDSLSEEIARLKRQITGLKAELSETRSDNHRLRRRNAELEALGTKDSHNSSRPPSTDPPWRKRTKSLRRPSGRGPGGQAGHPGHTLRLTQKPTRVVIHRPVQCRHCLSPLREGRSIDVERRQVIDLVPARLRVTEHRVEVVRCSACGRRTKAAFPAGVRATVQYGPRVIARALYLHDYQLLPYARTAEAMRELFGCAVSTGTLSTAVRQCASGLVETELKIKRGLRRSSVIHADETGLRVEGQLHYVHVASTPRLTHYGADARRGKAAIDEIGILPQYRGTCVHDGWLSYTFYPKCRHALCGAHLLRELIYFEELSEETKAWAGPLKELLLEMKDEAERVCAQGEKRLTAERLAPLTASYDKLVAAGLKAQPPPEVPEQVRRQGRNLLLRLGRRKEEVLRFLSDFSVPFDNNQAERDLRMIKLRQKTSGCFRTEEGARRFCRIRSYVSTARKQGKGVLRALEGACRGAPLSVRKRKG
ncbi:MAG: IS66 family transposase [Acidobacteria bacterium]|nr:IS66 family transposase [Acidobacteriota bacterium]